MLWQWHELGFPSWEKTCTAPDGKKKFLVPNDAFHLLSPSCRGSEIPWVGRPLSEPAGLAAVTDPGTALGNQPAPSGSRTQTVCVPASVPCRETAPPKTPEGAFRARQACLGGAQVARLPQGSPLMGTLQGTPNSSRDHTAMGFTLGKDGWMVDGGWMDG